MQSWEFVKERVYLALIDSFIIFLLFINSNYNSGEISEGKAKSTEIFFNISGKRGCKDILYNIQTANNICHGFHLYMSSYKPSFISDNSP